MPSDVTRSSKGKYVYSSRHVTFFLFLGTDMDICKDEVKDCNKEYRLPQENRWSLHSCAKFAAVAVSTTVSVDVQQRT